jgi:polyisoprenyl-phosphate glycosyltransferase
MITTLSVIVPVYNASSTLKELYRRIRDVTSRVADEVHIIFVDDCSSDDSFQVISQLAESDSLITGIILETNSGQQNALLCGLRHSQAEFAITIDDDLQYPPEYIPEILHKINEGYDFVYGIPEIRSESSWRNMGTFMVKTLLQLICMKPKGIEVSSFRIMRKKLVDEVILDTRSRIYLSATSFLASENAAVIYIKTEKGPETRYTLERLLKVFGNLALYYIPILKEFRKKDEQYRVKTVVGKGSVE